MWWTSTGSARIASTIGPGSASPLVSSTICSSALGARLGPAALVADAAQQRDQIGPRRAAGAAAGQHRDARRARQQHIVDRRFGRLVDDDESVRVTPGMELVAQPGRLARAEKAAEHREPHAAIGCGVKSAASSPPPMKRGSSGSTGRPASRSAAAQTSARSRDDGRGCRTACDLDARHLRAVMRGQPIGRQHRLQHLARGGNGRAAGPARRPRRPRSSGRARTEIRSWRTSEPPSASAERRCAARPAVRSIAERLR